MINEKNYLNISEEYNNLLYETQKNNKIFSILFKKIQSFEN